MVSAVLTAWYQFAGIIVALPVAAGIAWALFRGIGHMQRVHEAIIGRPGTPYSDHVPGLVERFTAVTDHLDAQDDRLDQIEAEFSTNSGLTVKDDLKALRADVTALKAGQARAAATAVTVAADVAHIATDAAAHVAHTATATAADVAKVTVDTADRLAHQ